MLFDSFRARRGVLLPSANSEKMSEHFASREDELEEGSDSSKLEKSLRDAQCESVKASGWQQSREIKLVRSASQSLYARLRSIEWDSRRVLELHSSIAGDFPLFANARAGVWYVPPECSFGATKERAHSNICCFKSADGHYGQWNASTRRPNIPLLRAAVESGGAVVVDATRAGKVYPDALTKTIPIWCAVVNAVAGLTAFDQFDELLRLPRTVPPSEREAILKLLPGWVETWKSSGLNLGTLVPGFVEKSLQLRPLWVRADADLLWENGLPSAESLGFIPIVCVSASPPLREGTRAYVEPDCYHESEQHHIAGALFPRHLTGFAYVQGAGDDEESWSCGLTRDLFWRNRDKIYRYLENVSGELLEKQSLSVFIHELRSSAEAYFEKNAIHMMGDTDSASASMVGHPWELMFEAQVGVRVCNSFGIVADSEQAASEGAAIVIVLTSKRLVASEDKDSRPDDAADGLEVSHPNPKIHWFSLTNFRGKPDYKHGLCRALGACLDLLHTTLGTSGADATEKPYGMILCDSNCGDWASGLAASWIAWHCDEDLRLLHGPGRATVDKSGVQNVLLRIHSTHADLVVSRNTQQQINRFFQSPAPSSSVASWEAE
jgi:Rit1 N-terminal domain